MASSGDYSFNQNCYQIITGAMRLIGAIQTGETPPAEEYEDALSALNGLVTHWQASGIHVWSEVDAILLLQPNQISYQIGPGSPDQCFYSKDWSDSMLPGGPFPTETLPRPLRVPAARRYHFAPFAGAQPIETPMSVLSRIDYAKIPNKTTTGIPTQFFYDPQLILGVMNIWPAPLDTTNAVKFTAQRPLQDFVSQRDNADLPIEWISCLRFSLAMELAPEYDCPAERFQVISQMALSKLGMCQAWDREPESVYFGLENFPATRN